MVFWGKFNPREELRIRSGRIRNRGAQVAQRPPSGVARGPLAVQVIFLVACRPFLLEVDTPQVSLACSPFGSRR